MQKTFVNSRHCLGKQSGMSAVGFMFFVAIFVFVLLSVLKIVPIYIENMSIQSILEGIEEEYSTTTKQPSQTEIKSLLQKRFNINQITQLPVKDIQIKKDKTHYLVTANYETRIDFLANIDVVIVFDKNIVKIPRQ